MTSYKREHRWTLQDPRKLTFRQEQFPNSRLTVKGNVKIKSYDPRKKEQSESVIIDLDMQMNHRDVESMVEIQAVKDGVIVRVWLFKRSRSSALLVGCAMCGVGHKVTPINS